MDLSEALVEVWRQVLAEQLPEVRLGAQNVGVTRSRNQRLRVVSFTFGEHKIDGVEQNPEKPSRWGQLAREGKRILQFSSRSRYFANVCEGALTRYPAWKALGLPE